MRAELVLLSEYALPRCVSAVVVPASATAAAASPADASTAAAGGGGDAAAAVAHLTLVQGADGGRCVAVAVGSSLCLVDLLGTAPLHAAVASHPQRMLTLAGDAGDVLGCYQAPSRPPTFSFWCVACGSCVGFGCIVEAHGNPAMCAVWRRA